MMLQFTVLQQLDGGVPGPIGLVVLAILYMGLAASGWKRRTAAERHHADRWLLGGVALHYVTLALVMIAFDPSTHRSTGIHQTHGPCHVPQRDITGHVRDEFLCVSDFDEDFSFDCVPSPPVGTGRWYTVCGRAHTRRGLHVGALVGLGLAGIALFASLLRIRDTRG